jgi:division protein CdvB (Snf7/Vps24/ESCRT-III family)
MTLPDLTQTTAADADLPLEIITAEGEETLDYYVLASRLEEYAKRLKEFLKDSAEQVVSSGVKESLGSKVSLRRTNVYDYGSDARLSEYQDEADKTKEKMESISAALKARQKQLIESGVATITETKTSISVSK